MKKLPILALVLFLFSCQKSIETANDSLPKFDQAAEEKAIMKVIENETSCFFKGDYECWTKSWSHQPYAMQAWNNDNGTFDAAVGWDKINSQGKGWIEKYYKNGENVIHPKFKRDTIQFKFFNEKTAYLIWRQVNADAKGPKAQVSQETRIMEKEADGWKIVNVTAIWDSKNKITY
ncbi:MAG: hypothetical protein V4683_08465 [Bacteroidota bacterium]